MRQMDAKKANLPFLLLLLPNLILLVPMLFGFYLCPCLQQWQKFQNISYYNNFLSLQLLKQLMKQLNQTTMGETRHRRGVSIHALTPLSIKPINYQNSPQHKYKQHFDFKSIPQSPKAPALINYFQTPSKNQKLIQSLFMEEEQVLRRLQQQTKRLSIEKKKLVETNQKQYQLLVDKLIDIRRICNKRKQDMEKLKKELREIQEQDSFKKLFQFSNRNNREKISGFYSNHERRASNLK